METKNGITSRDIEILNDIELLFQDAQLNVQKGITMIYVGVPRSEAFKEVIEVNKQVLEIIQSMESSMVKLLAGVQFLEFNNGIQDKIKGINL